MSDFKARSRVVPACIAVAWLSHGSAASAAQLAHFTLAEHGRVYRIAFDAVVAAPKQRVFAALSDYAHLERINPEIISSTYTRAPSGSGARVRTVLHSCIWLFCRNLVQVEDVRDPDPDTILAQIVPGAGDFSGGSSRWRLTSDGAETRLHYEARREAGSWVPSFLGRSVIQRALRAHFKASLEALEHVASHRS